MATTAGRPAVTPPPSSTPALLQLLRPRQWVKNLLVFAAPGAAGVLTQRQELLETLVAFVAFCLAASGTYCLNDAADAEADRAHPTKRRRPVASGAVPAATARAIGVGLVVAGVAIGFLTGSWHLPAMTAGYVAVTTAYTLWLKHIAVVDLAAVAAGFVLRTLAGAAATGVEVSDWFLIVASFGSLFMVAGKRSAELDGEGAGRTRAVLSQYSAQFLTYVRSLSSAVAVAAYCLWAFEEAGTSDGFPWFELSIVPFVLGILRYGLRLDQGEGGAPEDVVLGDRTLQVIGIVWVATFGLGVHVR
jgi:decaprenyl-phosphate phosphoribosyltransferase